MEARMFSRRLPVKTGQGHSEDTCTNWWKSRIEIPGGFGSKRPRAHPFGEARCTALEQSSCPQLQRARARLSQVAMGNCQCEGCRKEEAFQLIRRYGLQMLPAHGWTLAMVDTLFPTESRMCNLGDGVPQSARTRCLWQGMRFESGPGSDEAQSNVSQPLTNKRMELSHVARRLRSVPSALRFCGSQIFSTHVCYCPDLL